MMQGSHQFVSIWSHITETRQGIPSATAKTAKVNTSTMINLPLVRPGSPGVRWEAACRHTASADVMAITRWSIAMEPRVCWPRRAAPRRRLPPLWVCSFPRPRHQPLCCSGSVISNFSIHSLTAFSASVALMRPRIAAGVPLMREISQVRIWGGFFSTGRAQRSRRPCRAPHRQGGREDRRCLRPARPQPGC